MNSHQRIDEYVWQDVTLLKATLLETRAKLLLQGGHFDNGEELCRTCIIIRTVMLGHNHPQTLAAQETLAKLVRMRSKI
ncbi:putative tetratricopeptide-like helical domain superfamily [Helianthus debilis subsp. tardiflorus]